MNLRPSPARMWQLAPLALVLVSAVVAVGIYLQTLHYPFISDDSGYVTENSKLAGLRLTELWRLFTEPYNDFSEFLPLRDLSYWFDITLFGLNPTAFRMHSILLYLLCLPLVYATMLELWRYFRPVDAASAPWAAAAVTALFALHPSHTEAVVWIAGRKDVLAGMFSLFALWLAVRVKQEQGLSAPYAAATLVALLAAMLSKATAVAVAPLIAILWVIFWRDIPAPNRRRFLLLWPFASLLLAACIALVFAAIITTRIPLYFGIEAATRSLAVLGWLARLAVSPESRHFFYPVFEDTYLPAMVALGLAVLAAAVAGMVMILRRRSLEGFALVAFLLLCGPSMQLIPYAPPSLASDRFVFLAVWPAVLLVVALSWRLKPVPRTAILLVIALAWGFQAAERTRDWRSFEVLVDSDFHAFPGYSMPAMYKSDIQLSKGLFREAGETASGITIPEVRNTMIKLVKAHQAVTDSTSTGDPHNAMAILLDFGLGLKQTPVQAQWDAPIGIIWRINRKYLEFEWQKLVKRFPNDVLVRYNAGSSLLSIRKYEDAIVHLRAATESQRLPESLRGTAFKNLGVALLNSGHAAEAEAPLRAALEQSPSELSAYCSLSAVYKQTSRLEEAARAEADCRSRVPNEGSAQ
jgi:protein O-mannosyl-transferase